MLDAVLGVARDAGRRVTLLGILPTALLALFLLGLVWGGAPGDAPSVDRFVAHVESLSTAELLLLCLALLGVAVLSQPLQLPLVRILEGYWTPVHAAEATALGRDRSWSRAPSRALTRIGTAAAEARRHRHRERRALLEAAQLRTAADQADAESDRDGLRRQAAWRLRKFYPPDPLVMPTALGNALRAAEDRAGRRYGLDTVVIWPRLYPLLSDRVLAILDDQRTQLDVAVRFCVVLLLAALASLGLLIAQGWLLLIPAAALVLAWLAYRAAVAAAVVYGDGLETAFDLHRFDLLRTLHLPLPATSEEERALNAQVTAFLLQGQRVPFAYEHSGAGTAAEDGPAAAVSGSSAR